MWSVLQYYELAVEQRKHRKDCPSAASKARTGFSLFAAPDESQRCQAMETDDEQARAGIVCGYGLADRQALRCNAMHYSPLSEFFLCFFPFC